MVSILIVEKSGIIKSTTLKTYNEAELYKKAGMKTCDGFCSQTTWKLGSNVNIRLFGKTTGRAGQENKYDFPPPVDNELYFGSCILVNLTDDGEAIDLQEKQWTVVYEKLFGGFEDLGAEDSEDEEDEDEEDEDVPRTKEGYVKDDFVVDDDEEEEDEEEDEEEEDEDEEDDDDDEDSTTPKSKAKPALRRSKRGKSKAAENVFKFNIADEYLNCTSELSEEEYV